MEQVTCVVGQMGFNRRFVRLNRAETAVQEVERDAIAWHIEKFGQGGGGQPAMNAQFATWFDQAVDGDDGGDLVQGNAGAKMPDETSQEMIEAEELPGGQADMNIAEAARVGPNDGVGVDGDAADGPARTLRRFIADFLHEQGKPSRIRQPLGDVKPIGRAKVIKPAEIANGPLADRTVGGTRGFDEGKIGVSLVAAALFDSAEKHGMIPRRAVGTQGGRQL